MSDGHVPARIIAVTIVVAALSSIAPVASQARSPRQSAWLILDAFHAGRYEHLR